MKVLFNNYVHISPTTEDIPTLFKVQRFKGSKVQGSRFKVQGSKFKVQRFKV